MAQNSSVLVVDVVRHPPVPNNVATVLTDGTAHIAYFGATQRATVKYHWANEYEKDNLMVLPKYGLDVLFPVSEGWVIEPPNIEEISDTIHIFNITVTATRYLPKYR